jgi:hypothetical protein
METGIYVLLGVIGFLIFLWVIGFRVIPSNKIGILEKWWSPKGSLNEQILALKGEAGYQPEVLRGGIHFRTPLMYKIHKCSLVTIPQGQIAYVFSRDGKPLEPTQTLGKIVPQCNNFQNVRAFLENGGQKGPQRGIIREGTYAFNLAQFIIITEDKIYSICKILQYKMDLQFVIYDYLKSAEKDSSSQYNDLGNKTNFLKNNIAGELGLAVLAGAQLNRHNEISDSYKIEQYLSSELMLEPKTTDQIAQDGEECGNYTLFVKLNRNGEQMTEGEYIDLVFTYNTVSLDQAATQHTISVLPI